MGEGGGMHGRREIWYYAKQGRKGNEREGNVYGREKENT